MLLFLLMVLIFTLIKSFHLLMLMYSLLHLKAQDILFVELIQKVAAFLPYLVSIKTIPVKQENLPLPMLKELAQAVLVFSKQLSKKKPKQTYLESKLFFAAV